MTRTQTASSKSALKAGNSRNGVSLNGHAHSKKDSKSKSLKGNGVARKIASKNNSDSKKTRKANGKTASKLKREAKKSGLNKKDASKKILVTTRKSNKSQKAKAAPRKAAGLSKLKKPGKELLLAAYQDMYRARLNDEKAIILYKQNKCHFQIGVAGHEAVQVATAKVMQAAKDWFYPYYRDMALCAALGMTDREFMLNAMNKQDDPNSHGRQMPMHYGHKALNIVNQSSPTGTQFLQAVGCAMASRKLGLDEVTYVSAGEGTTSQGDFHEALNWAARDRLPVIFLIQNNKYAISVPIWEQIAGQSVAAIAQGYENLEVLEVDGTDFSASYAAVSKAYDRALKGEGPTLIEAHVPRLQSHSISDNHKKYRDEKDIEGEWKRCPIIKLRKEILKDKLISKPELDALEEKIKQEIDAAAEWAEAQPDPSPAEATRHTFVDHNPMLQLSEPTLSGEEIYMVDALNHALHEEMQRDENVFVFGQDVAHGKGGVFTVTTGLTDAFGVNRCFNAPLAESSIAGVAVGLATRGLKPVAEIQFGDYVWTAMMQLRNELAMMNYRSGGDFTCPAVIRIPIGGYIHGACYHSQNIEATFAHFPGLHVVLPSNASDAKGLLKSAIRSPDPVLFLEHKGLYRQVYAKGAEGGAEDLIPLGKARVLREGSDLTIVTYGAIVNKSLLAAKELAEQEGVSIEVIDLRSIVPLDTQTIFQSVRKTGRVLVAHEDTEFMGFGAEIAAQIAEHCFEQLDAPVNRIGMKYVGAVAHAPAIEAVVLPQNEDLLVAARNLLAY